MHIIIVSDLKCSIEALHIIVPQSCVLPENRRHPLKKQGHGWHVVVLSS